MFKHAKTVVIVIIFLFLSINSWGALTTYTWDNGGALGDWTDPLNWDLDLGYPNDDLL